MTDNLDSAAELGGVFDSVAAAGLPFDIEELDDEPLLRAGVQYRVFGAQRQVIDADARTVQLAISSEEGVERSFGTEILVHDEDAIDLKFLRSGRAPLLLDHDPRKQIGVVESVQLDETDRRLRAVVRFGRSGLASEVFGDVEDGIRANVSIGYRIADIEKADDEDGTVSPRRNNHRWTVFSSGYLSKTIRHFRIKVPIIFVIQN